MEMYTQFDVISLVTVLIFITIGLVKGGVRSVIGILKWYGAFIVALMFYPYVKTLVAEVIVDSPLANAGAVILVYIAGLLVLALIGEVIVKSFGLFIGGFLDRMIGAIVGFLIGYVIISSAHFAIKEVFKDNVPEWFEDSKTYAYTEYGSEFLKDYLQGSVDSVKDDFGMESEIQKYEPEDDMGSDMQDNNGFEDAQEKSQQISGDLEINLQKILERANQLKDMGYEPDEIKSIIEQEQQMER